MQYSTWECTHLCFTNIAKELIKPDFSLHFYSAYAHRNKRILFAWLLEHIQTTVHNEEYKKKEIKQHTWFGEEKNNTTTPQKHAYV